MSFQSYFVENKDNIFAGRIPERYRRVARYVPGDTILEVGSADGTQALVLAKERRRVYGVELMSEQHEMALSLRDHWLGIGIDVQNCEFYKGDALAFSYLLDCVDTVLLSRVLYHLREDINVYFETIRVSGVKCVALVGCPVRERNWHTYGARGDMMGKYTYYASQVGMENVLREFGFQIVTSLSSEGGEDPMVVGSRQGA